MRASRSISSPPSPLPVSFASAATPAALAEAVSLGIDRVGITLRDLQAVVGTCRVTFENLAATAIDIGPATVRSVWRKSPSES